MNIEANKAIVRKYIELWSTGNFALADEIIVADFVDHRHPDQGPAVPSPINHAAIKLLRSWREDDEYNEEEMRTTWEYLKQALDEDRLSNRKLFP